MDFREKCFRRLVRWLALSTGLLSLAADSGIAGQPAPIVVGVDNAPPLYYTHSDMPVEGLAIDVMNEAARRLGYQIVWRPLKGQPDGFLLRGEVDMWPVLSVTPERQKVFHMTKPWLRNTYCLLSLSDHVIQDSRAAAGQKIAHWTNSVNTRIAQQFLGNSILVSRDTRPHVVQAVCRREVAAAFIEARILEHLILERPEGCEAARLVVHELAGAESELAIASTRAKAAVADQFLDTISEMSENGVLDDLVGRWSLFRANETRSIVALRNSERRNRLAMAGLAVFALTAIALFWHVRKGRRTEIVLRREMLDRHRAQEATRYAIEQLEHQAHHDPLTGLPNRLLFERILRDSLAIARNSGTRVGLLYLDLDRFKQINDSLGHAAGDALLRQAADRLNTVLPERGFLARLGGDEFALILAAVPDKLAAEKAAAKVNRVLSEPFVIEGALWHCPASLGLSMFPDDAQSAAVLQRNADTAMYRAKRTSPGGLVAFARFMSEQAERSLSIEQALRTALAQERFYLHYQAQFGQEGELRGFEALLRLEDLRLGPISPAEFIPVAEDTGLIVPIGEWVLREACRQAVQWVREGTQLFTMSVNVSPIQLAKGGFPELVDAVLMDTGMRPDLLELELTETTVVANAGGALRSLKQSGVRIAVDDFGTGYSSLSYLHRLPADCIKIDRSFIRDAAGSPGTLPFICTIISLARSLGMTTVAEGVETNAQLEAVRGAGCERVQGNLLAAPLPAASAGDLLREHSVEFCAA